MTARRIASITPFHVMALLARARELEAQGRSIVHMEIGEPDFATPQPIIDAGIRALQEGRTHYTPAVGLRELREAIARDYLKHDGLEIDPRRIIVTPGASGALQLLLALLVDPGSEVLMTDPGYPCNSNFVRLFDGKPVRVPVGAAQRYQLDAGSIEAHWHDNTVCAMITSPSNPTGTVIAPDSLEALYAAVRARGGGLIVDEIYQGLTYGERPRSALALGDDLFVINSFSKFQGMTGWRLGWLVAPESSIDALDALAQNLFLAAPTLAQYAALAAYEDEARAIIESRRQAFQARRDYLLPALTGLGFDIPVQPEGAFYLYANCEHLTDDSFAFTHDLLEQAGVAITPGIDFGEWKAQHHVRFAYTTSVENLKLGVERISEYTGRKP